LYQYRTRQCNVTENFTKNNKALNIGSVSHKQRRSTDRNDAPRVFPSNVGIQYLNEDILPGDWFAQIFDKNFKNHDGHVNYHNSNPNQDSELAASEHIDSIIEKAVSSDDRETLISVYNSEVDSFGCLTDQKEYRPCVQPVSGCWSSWASWSECSMSCNSGIRSRKRYCENGGDCKGENESLENCNSRPCEDLDDFENKNTCIVCDGEDCDKDYLDFSLDRKFDPGPGDLNDLDLISKLSRTCPSNDQSSSFYEYESTPEPVGCQSQVVHENGVKKVSKTCRSNYDCYADLADLLATGQCDMDNEQDSTCIYCCEGKDCNEGDQFESSFWVFLKLSFQKSPPVKLKNAGMFRNESKVAKKRNNGRRNGRQKFDRRWFKKMYDDFFDRG